ncbi:glutamate receptor-like [Centruroides vittatus]|uniref:glutamate receptor-like n=1 Tax=Centruroides vittatus TaxID=120091 RepID=UPI0035108290
MKNSYYNEGDPETSKYEGLLIDLLLKLQEMHDFKFKFYEIEQYGNENTETKEWNGLVRQLMDKGTEFEQKNNLPAKIIMLTWWLTTVILIAAYTAKLAAFMTVQNMKQEISSLEDLVKLNTIPFGTLKDSYVENFFANSHYEIHKIAYKMMKNYNTFVNDTLEGLERVRASYYLPEGHKDRFALISDSPLVDYASMQRPCNVERVGRLFGLQNYGFGLPKGSPFEKLFTSSILKLREDGYMDLLNKRWFINSCPDNRIGSEEHQMDIKNLSGVFLCYLGGLIVALLFVAVLWIREMTKSRKKVAVSTNIVVLYRKKTLLDEYPSLCFSKRSALNKNTKIFSE